MILKNHQVEERWQIMELVNRNVPRADDEVAVFESIVNKAVPYLVKSISTIQDGKKIRDFFAKSIYGRVSSISQK